MAEGFSIRRAALPGCHSRCIILLRQNWNVLSDDWLTLTSITVSHQSQATSQMYHIVASALASLLYPGNVYAGVSVLNCKLLDRVTCSCL